MGQSGATATADKVVVNWWVTAVDVAAGTISVVNPAGGADHNVTTQAAATSSRA